ncbi:MAG: DUF1566 domain-containing protein [Gammaproteobacteria bacterium]
MCYGFIRGALAADAELESLERQYEALQAAETRRAEEETRAQLSILTDAGGGVLLQPARGLEWTQADNGRDINWRDARAHCAARGGGWRLPKVEELQSLIGHRDTGAPCGKLTCKVSRLFRLSEPFFWSGDPNGPADAWCVNLRDGTRYSDAITAASSSRALCVR